MSIQKYLDSLAKKTRLSSSRPRAVLLVNCQVREKVTGQGESHTVCQQGLLSNTDSIRTPQGEGRRDEEDQDKNHTRGDGDPHLAWFFFSF